MPCTTTCVVCRSRAIRSAGKTRRCAHLVVGCALAAAVVDEQSRCLPSNDAIVCIKPPCPAPSNDATK